MVVAISTATGTPPIPMPTRTPAPLSAACSASTSRRGLGNQQGGWGSSLNTKYWICSCNATPPANDYEYPKNPVAATPPHPPSSFPRQRESRAGARRGDVSVSASFLSTPSVIPAKAGIQGRGAGRGIPTANRRATPIANPTAGAIRKSPAPKPVPVRPEPVEGPPPDTLTPPPCPDAPTDATVLSW